MNTTLAAWKPRSVMRVLTKGVLLDLRECVPPIETCAYRTNLIYCPRPAILPLRISRPGLQGQLGWSKRAACFSSLHKSILPAHLAISIITLAQAIKKSTTRRILSGTYEIMEMSATVRYAHESYLQARMRSASILTRINLDSRA